MNSANYVPDRQPVFYSDRSQFVITIPNLNYENEMIKSILAEDDREQVAGQVIGQVCGLSGRANFRENHLRLLLEKGVVKMTILDKPNSRNQRYYSE